MCSASLNKYFTSPTINDSVLTLSLDELSSHAGVVNIETKAPKPGAHNPERATAINSCNGVFTSEFIFR